MKKQVNDTRDQNTDVPSSLFLHDIVEVGFHVSVIIVTSSVTIGTDIETQKPSSVRSKKKFKKNRNEGKFEAVLEHLSNHAQCLSIL